MNLLLTNVKQNYYNIFMEHIQLFHGELMDFFDTYPDINTINCDQNAVSLNGSVFINKGKSEILTDPDGAWSNEPARKIPYSVVIEDKEGNTHKLKNIFPKIEELITTIREINKNPIVGSGDRKVVFHKTDNCIPSFKKIYGDDLANFLLSAYEKKQLSTNIDNTQVRKAKETHKI